MNFIITFQLAIIENNSYPWKLFTGFMGKRLN